MNLTEAGFQRPFPGTLFLSNAPSQIHFDELHLPLAAELPQRRPCVAHQRLALLFMSRKVEETNTRIARLLWNEELIGGHCGRGSKTGQYLDDRPYEHV